MMESGDPSAYDSTPTFIPAPLESYTYMHLQFAPPIATTPPPYAPSPSPMPHCYGTYVPTSVFTVSSPDTSTSSRNAPNQSDTPQHILPPQSSLPPITLSAQNETSAPSQPTFAAPAPRHAFQPAGFHLCGSPGTDGAGTPSANAPLWNVVGTPQDYGTPFTDASAWTPVTPTTPSPIQWQGDAGLNESVSGAGQGGLANYPFKQLVQGKQ